MAYSSSFHWEYITIKRGERHNCPEHPEPAPWSNRDPINQSTITWSIFNSKAANPAWNYCIFCVFLGGFILSKEATLSFTGTCEFIEAAPFWSPEVFCLGPRSCWAFHKVIYSRLQPFTASPLEMTLWNPSFPSSAMPRAAANSACLKTDEVFLLQFFWVGILKKASIIIISSNHPPCPMIIKTL